MCFGTMQEGPILKNDIDTVKFEGTLYMLHVPYSTVRHLKCHSPIKSVIVFLYT